MNKLKISLIITILSLVLIVAISIAWILSASYNRSGEIASAILFGQNSVQEENLNDQIISSALITRFPAGSSPENFKNMISNHGGECQSRQNGSIGCRLPRTAIPCMSSWLDFSIDVSPDGRLKNIKAYSKGLAC